MTSIFSFPFEQIGQGLRALSLSGTFGNIVAILLYTALSISPVLYMAYRKRKGRLIREDFFLPFISLCLFVGIYIYINPGYLRNFVAPFAVSDSYLLAIGSTLWSIIICYVVFRILHDVEHKESIDLLRLMQNLLTIVILLVIWNIVIVICVLTVAENILQLLCSHFLLTTYYQITIPIYTLLLVFVILLFSKKLSENRTLKLDNDSII